MQAGISKNNIKAFKSQYDYAVKHNQEVFIFEGQEVLTAYAKYLIEYFETLVK